MSEVPYTHEQNDAIYSRDQRLLVSAGAGSGKTTVLVERIVSWIENGASVSRLLAVTFTNAAAAGMRSRIAQALEKRSSEQPENRHIRCELALLPKADICTLHSFCMDLLRREGRRIGISPTARVAKEPELSLLRQEVMEELLENEYADPRSALPLLADAYGGNADDGGVVELIYKLHEYSVSRRDPRQWLESTREAFAYRPDPDNYPCALYLDGELCTKLQEAVRQFEELSRPQNGVLRSVKQVVAGYAADTAVSAQPGLGLCRRLRLLGELKFGVLRTKSKKTDDVNDAGEVINTYDESITEVFANEVKRVRDRVNELKKKYCVRSADEMYADLARLRPLVDELVRLTLLFSERFAAAKRSRDIIDFSDMEQLCLRLLEIPEVAADMGSSYDQVLVDEYQDINEVQETIISCLSEKCHLFVVGDVKQSIYRFRLAEPALFMNKYDVFGRGIGGRRIDLNLNYRSSRSILQGVNFVFRQLMSGGKTDICYDEAAALRPGLEEEGVPPEFHLITRRFRGENGEGAGNMELQARLLCRRIRELHENDGYAYADMVILLRKTRSEEKTISEVLRKAAIPVLGSESEEFLDAPEVQLVLSLLQVIDNPQQDIPLVAVLRSPLVGFTPEQLVELRLLRRDVGFYQLLLLAAYDDAADPALGAACRDFLRRLEQWRELAAVLPVSQLLRRLYRERGFYQLSAALPDGRIRCANLQLLLNKARQYDGNYCGLFRFVRQFEDGRALKVREDMSLPSEAQDAVRIMTIHRSKGLEFPVVFVLGLDGKFSDGDTSPDVIWERELGLGLRLVDREQHYKLDTLAHDAVSLRLRHLQRAEELRILYVAMTRAQQRLIMIGGAAITGKSWDNWRPIGDTPALSEEQVVSAGCFRDWMITALLRHPDADELRRHLSAPDSLALLPDPGHWQISVYTPDMPESMRDASESAAEQKKIAVDSGLLQQVREKLDYCYPYRQWCNYPVKWSVSALNRLAADPQQSSDSAVLSAAAADAEADALSERTASEQEADVAVTVGSEARNQASSATERGSNYHRIMELLDLRDVSAEGLSRQVEALSVRLPGFVPDSSRIAWFFTTELGQRMIRSARVERERAFTMRQPLGEREYVLLQGVLDAAFMEDDGWVLLDYKTGGFGKSDAAISEIYREQLAYYRQAMERLWRVKVKECWLVMLDLGRNIRL